MLGDRKGRWKGTFSKLESTGTGRMARNLSPAVRRELANLKDANSQKSAMKALKSYVKDLDSNAIPLFLEEVSETKETGSISGEYTISLYEVLAHYHGVNIVPQIDSIMVTIVKTLASSAGSFPLQQACSKVVPAIAMYGIDPTTPEKRRTHIIDSLCKPLSESLLGCQESLTSGSALCLKALVESDNWKFASDEMVNKVCLNVAAALEEKSTQTNSHMGLAMALAKHNSLTVEAYARLLIQSGLRVLNVEMKESNSQKRLAAIQMVNFLMKSLDHRSVYSELELIMNEMEKCQSDQMAFIKGAAFEALQTATQISKDKELKFEKESSSVTGSNCSRDLNNRSSNWGSGDQSSSCVSPESQTLGSSLEYDSPFGTPVSSRPVSPSSNYDMVVNYKRPWKWYPNGGVDTSLKDGIFSVISEGNGFVSNSEQSKHCDSNCNGGPCHSDAFVGFQQKSSNNGTAKQSLTPSLQNSFSQIDVDNIRIFSTPRKLIHSLQEDIDTNSGAAAKKSIGFRSICSSVCTWSPLRKYNENGFRFTHNASKENGSPSDLKPQFLEESSSTNGRPSIVKKEKSASEEEIPVEKNEIVVMSAKTPRRFPFRFICSLFILILSIFTSLLWLNGQHEDVHLVPT